MKKEQDFTLTPNFGVTPRQSRKGGFTLIELLVVISIIGLLASVVLVSLNSARLKARDVRRVADMKQIMTALDLYYDNNGRYPDADVEPGNPPAGCYSWDTSGKGTFISALKTSGIMSRVPTDPSGTGYCLGAAREYRYYRYDPGWCNPCNGKYYYVLGVNYMETLSAHNNAATNYPGSPGFICAGPNPTDWSTQFDWVVGRCE